MNWDELYERAQEKKKSGNLYLRVTSVVNMFECPLRTVLYSDLNTGSTKPAKAMIEGTICHNTFNRHFDLDMKKETDIEALWLKLWNNAVTELDTRRQRSARGVNEWNLYEENKDFIENRCRKRYFGSFMSWLSTQKKPTLMLRERSLKYGIISGTFDALWDDMLIDFKTSKARLTNEEYIDGYYSQLGGYVYLLRNNGFRVKKAKLVVLCLQKHQELVLEGDELENYVEDFEGKVSYATRMLSDLLNKRKVPYRAETCYKCLAREACSKLKYDK